MYYVYCHYSPTVNKSVKELKKKSISRWPDKKKKIEKLNNSLEKKKKKKKKKKESLSRCKEHHRIALKRTILVLLQRTDQGQSSYPQEQNVRVPEKTSNQRMKNDMNNIGQRT